MSTKPKVTPEAIKERPELEPMAKDADLYHSLEAIANQEGGKVLIKTLMDDTVDSIEALVSGYKKMSLPDMQAYCATIAANLGVIRALTRSGKNKKLVDEALEEALKE